MLVLNEISEVLPKSHEPLIKQIYDKAGYTLLAIGLRRGIELPKYAVPSKAKLMVVQGEIDLNTATHSYRLECFDTFDIPIDVEHSIVGVFDAIFLLLVGKTQQS